MSYRFCILLFQFILSCSVYAQSVSYSDKPSWVEDFEGSKVDESKWRYETHFDGKRNLTTDNNVRVHKGKLYLTLYKGHKWNKKMDVCLRIFSKAQYNMRYGKVVIRAKMPLKPGCWPALWIRPQRGLNEKVVPEIDLIEWISCFNKNTFQANFHLWGEFDGKKGNHTQYPKKYTLKRGSLKRFHLYSAEWDPEKLIIKFDDQVVGTWWKKDYPVWPFDMPQEVCLQMSFGGWGASCSADDNVLPQSTVVDWVKYYKLKK